MNLAEVLEAARVRGDFGPLVAGIPYARFLGLSLALDEQGVLAKLAFQDINVGNPSVKALHGGTLGALLEFAAVGHVLHGVESASVPRTINLTIEYLRSAGFKDTYARCRIERLGRRVVVVRVTAFQDDPEKPVAAATVQLLISPPDGEVG